MLRSKLTALEQEIFTTVIEANEQRFKAILKDRKFNSPKAHGTTTNRNLLNDEGVNLVQAIIQYRHEFQKNNNKDAANRLLRMLTFLLEESKIQGPSDPKRVFNLDQQTYQRKTALHYAADFNDIEVVNLLLQHGADTALTDEHGDNILLIAARREPRNLLNIILKTKLPKDSYNATKQTTPAYIACFFGFDSNLKLLLQQGFAIPIPGKEYTLLQVAVDFNHLACIKVLLDSPRYTFSHTDYLFAFRFAVEKRNFDLLQTLINKFKADTIDFPAEMLAQVIKLATGSNPELDSYAVALIELIPANAVNSIAYADLYFEAVEKNNPVVTDFLLRKNIPFIEDQYGFTPFDHAVYLGNNCIHFLFVRSFNYLNHTGENAMHRAIRLRSKPLLEYLLNKNDHLDDDDQKQFRHFYRPAFNYLETTRDGRTLLHYAAENEEILTLVLDRLPIDVNSVDINGYTPVFYAMRAREINSIKLLIARGADLTILPPGITSLLHYLEVTKSADLIPVLADYLNYDRLDAQGRSSLHIVAKLNLPDMIVKIVTHNATLLSSQDKEGNTPLHAACSAGSLESVKCLLDSGAPLIKNGHGETPLHLIAKANNPAIFNLLLNKFPEALFDVDAAGNTALHIAINSNSTAVIQLILKHPQAVKLLDISDNEQRSALSLLRANQAMFTEYLKLYPPVRDIEPAATMGQQPVLQQLTEMEMAAMKEQMAKEIVDTIVTNVSHIAHRTKKPRKKVKKKTSNSTEQTYEQDQKLSPSKSHEETPGGPSSRPTLPVSKKVIHSWGHLLFTTEQKIMQKPEPHSKVLGEPVSMIDFSEWHIPQNLISHPLWDKLTEIVSKELNHRPHEQFNMKDGIYVVGGQVLDILFLKKHHFKSNDIDLQIVGLSVDTLTRLLAANQINYDFNIHNGNLVVTVGKSTGNPIDIVCVSSEDFEAKMRDRAFTMTGCMLNMTKNQIAAPVSWLKDVKNRIIRTIKNPVETFDHEFQLKIRAIRNYAKLEDIGGDFDSKTLAALTSADTSFLRGKSSQQPGILFTIRHQLEKLFASVGLEKGLLLLNQFNMVDQVKIPLDKLKYLMSERLKLPDKFMADPSFQQFKDDFIRLVVSLGNTTDLPSWQKENTNALIQLAAQIERSDKASIERKFGLRLMSCVLMAGINISFLYKKSPAPIPGAIV